MDQIRILIVDDNKNFRDTLKEFLEFQKHVRVVGEANDRMEAIRLAFSLQPEIVLMPFSMSGEEDVTAAREIKKELPHTTIVLITAERPVKHRRLAKSVGIDALIPKYSLVKALPKLLNEVRARMSRPGTGFWQS